MLMPDIQCSKYADMLNDDRTLFQNPSCAIWQSLFGSQVSLEPSSTISPLSTKEFEGHLFIKLLPPLSHIDLPTVPVSHTKSIGAQAYDPPIPQLGSYITGYWLVLWATVGALGTQADDPLSEAGFLLATSESPPVRIQ